MEFLVQHYGYGQVGRWSNISDVGEDVHLGSDMWRFHTSDDRVCIYDKITKVGSKNCHTFFLSRHFFLPLFTKAIYAKNDLNLQSPAFTETLAFMKAAP